MDQTKETKSKIVETFAEDMAKVIEDDKTGLIKKIIHEEEEREIQKRNLSPESKKNKFFMLAGSVLILLGVGVFLYFFLQGESPAVPADKQFTPIIFHDQSVFIEVKDLKKEEIAQMILNKADEMDLKIGGVGGIYLTENKQVVGLRKFISLIKANFDPGRPVFVEDNFLLGVVNSAGEERLPGKDFFMLIKVRSISDVFDSMRAWENRMFSDLRQFFDIDLVPGMKYLFTKGFEDGIIENKNARILRTKEGEILMMYIMASEDSIIITNTKEAAHEIFLRLAASRIKK